MLARAITSSDASTTASSMPCSRSNSIDILIEKRRGGCMQAEATQAPGQPSNVTCFRAKLQEPLKPGSSTDLEWYSVHVGSMTPFPAKASQSDPQRVLLKGSHYASSPYPISTQTAKASLRSVAHADCLLSCTMRSMHNAPGRLYHHVRRQVQLRQEQKV